MDEARRLREIIEKYGDSLFRIGVMILGNKQDAEDVLQEVFIKYMQKAPKFVDEAHKKAWLFRCTHNLCKDLLRFRKRHKQENIDALQLEYMMEEDKVVLEEMMALASKYKEVLLLYYLEGYKISEIATMMKSSPNTIRKRLERGRKLLRNNLKEQLL